MGSADALQERQWFADVGLQDPNDLFTSVGDRIISVPEIGSVLLPDGCKRLEDAFSQEYALDI